jgi:FHS family Na+ dependent glucose MFS transporter 1
MASGEAAIRYRSTIVYYAAFVALGVMDASLGPTLPALAGRTGISLGEAGLLFSVRAFGYILGSFIGGRLYDRFAGHRLLAGACCVVAVTLALTPSAAAWAFVPLMGVLFMMGVGAGGVDVGGNTLLAWTHRERVGPFMAGLHLFFGIGASLAPIIVAQSFELRTTLDWTYWVMASFPLPVALLLLMWPSSPRRAVRTEAQPERALRATGLPMMAAFFFAFVGIELGFGGWIFAFATEQELLSAAQAAYLTSLYWGAFTLGRLVAIPLCVRLSLQRVVELSLLGAFSASAAMALWAGPSMLWLGSAMLGLSIGPLFPTMISLAEQRLKLTGKMTSLFLISSGLGAMTIPWFFGFLMQSLGAAVLLPAVVVNVTLLGLIYVALRRHWL